MKKSIYEYPRYYEVAFNYRDYEEEADFFEECIRRFSKVPVRRMIEPACGPAPHLAEILSRGYDYTGLDSSGIMLKYIEQKSEDYGVEVELIQNDMRTFRVRKKYDFAFSMLGSLQYILTDEDLISHLQAVDNCLKPGALYVIDAVINSHWYRRKTKREWEMKQDDIVVKSCFEIATPEMNVSQLTKVKASFEVEDGKKKVLLEDNETVKVYYPQEFFLLIKMSGGFEYIGSYCDFDIMSPLENKINGYPRIISVLRKI